MSAYESLAACYDELTYDIPYEKTLTFFERLCAREHVQPHSVLDLACGTGSLSLLLARRGYLGKRFFPAARRIHGRRMDPTMHRVQRRAVHGDGVRCGGGAEGTGPARKPPVFHLSAHAAPASGRAGRRRHLRARQPQLRDEARRLPEDLPPRL